MSAAAAGGAVFYLGSFLPDYQTPVGNSIYSIILFFLIFYITKPRFIYHRQDGRLLHFGTGKHQTLLPLWLLLSIVGVITYILTFMSVTTLTKHITPP